MADITFDIVSLSVAEIDVVDGAASAASNSVFKWLGIAGAIEWAGKQAYAAGVWVGEHS